MAKRTKISDLRSVGYSVFMGGVLFGVFYLFGSFSQASLDISTWSTLPRNFIGSVGGFVSLVFSVLTFLSYSE